LVAALVTQGSGAVQPQVYEYPVTIGRDTCCETRVVGGTKQTMGMPSTRPRALGPAPSYVDTELTRRLRRALDDPRGLDALWAETRADVERSAGAVDDELLELRRMLAQVDPLRALGALHMFDAIRRDELPGAGNFGSDAMLDLLATAICAEDEVAVLERIDTRFELQAIWTIEQVLRRIANHLATVEIGRVITDRARGASSPLLSMLRLEHALDRMAGFDPHVRRVVTAVFEKVDDRARTKLGYALSDSLAFASLYSQVRLIHADRANDAMADFPAPSRRAHRDQQVQWAAAHMTLFAMNSAAPLEGGELDEELARQLGLGDDEFASLLEAMSTGLGSVEADAISNDTSVRTRPLLRLSSGEWMWPRPVDFLHGAMEWALGVCKTDSSLLRGFDAARQSVAEDLTGDLLEEVFGSGNVFRNVTYPDVESNAESDTIVALPGVSMLVEVKGGRVSAAGRRGAPRSVDRHAKDLVEAAAKQNLRTADAIASDKKLTDGDGRTVPVCSGDDVVPLIVTLDRVDPFSTLLGQPGGGGPEDRNWVINLADLVMLVEILGTPEEFVAYARRRVELIRGQVRVFVEADCLGHWCADRLAGIRVISDPSGRRVEMVADTSETMNGYFTQQTIDHYAPQRSHGGARVDKPISGIPPQVLAVLETERARGSDNWPDLVDAVGKVTPAAWKPLDRLLGAIARRGDRPPNRQLQRALTRARDGWMIGDRVVVTLVSTEPLELGLAVVAPTASSSAARR
jgi:hypothetical protein